MIGNCIDRCNNHFDWLRLLLFLIRSENISDQCKFLKIIKANYSRIFIPLTDYKFSYHMDLKLKSQSLSLLKNLFMEYHKVYHNNLPKKYIGCIIDNSFIILGIYWAIDACSNIYCRHYLCFNLFQFNIKQSSVDTSFVQDLSEFFYFINYNDFLFLSGSYLCQGKLLFRKLMSLNSFLNKCPHMCDLQLLQRITNIMYKML